ncbi:hypothetical protein [Qipengyuania sphaerica]|uniref:hypothetical protein n=1 Tax=Qipengyuania sphaerica TaxID=2867243 RepID=UPI001C86C0D6|nr:hypothetical protein [Qipengyuania sphaerica]MBX7539543.1 hypothetical protein [Qipengyuania sphaerica]
MTTLASSAFSRVRIAYWALAAAVLLIPAVAMQFTAEVAWGPGDFAIMAGLLLLVGLGVELALRTTLRLRGKLLAIAAMLGLFLLVWSELAVGLFD